MLSNHCSIYSYDQLNIYCRALNVGGTRTNNYLYQRPTCTKPSHQLGLYLNGSNDAMLSRSIKLASQPYLGILFIRSVVYLRDFTYKYIDIYACFKAKTVQLHIKGTIT